MIKPFADLNLGLASAESESDSPATAQYLRDGFVDPQRSISQLLTGTQFLVLGEKGTGKSAVGHHLRLIGESSSLPFSTVVDYRRLRTAAFVDDLSALKQREEPIWAVALLAEVFKSLARDATAMTPEVQQALAIMQNAGFLTSEDLAAAAPTAPINRLDFKALTFGAGVAFGAQQRLKFSPSMLEQLIRTASRTSTGGHHLVVIDELDEALKTGRAGMALLGAMIAESKALNHEFARSGARIKIVLLCRPSVFEQLDDSNKNKMKQDNAIGLNWYRSVRTAEDSPLFTLVNLRAQIANDGARVDVVRRFFPTDRPMHRYLLQKTRHTPRDMLMLLKSIREECVGAAGVVSDAEIKSGYGKYSIEYFQPEVIDGVENFVDKAIVARCMSALRNVAKREFVFQEWIQQGRGVKATPDEIAAVADAMFQCSALANVHEVEPAPGKARVKVVHWKFRNRHSVLNRHETAPMAIHAGLWEAFDCI